MKNYQAILGSLVSFYVFISILDGSLQNKIHFSGIANEIACAVMVGVVGVLCLVAIDYKKLINGLK